MIFCHNNGLTAPEKKNTVEMFVNHTGEHMAFKFDTDRQIDKKSVDDQLPLIHTYMGRNKDKKEEVFLINDFKLSSSEEWLILTVRNKFTILVNTESQTFEYLQELMNSAYDSNQGIVCQYHAKSGCRAVFAVDDETIVCWEKDTDKENPLLNGHCNGKIGEVHPNHKTKQKRSPIHRKSNTEEQTEA